MLTDSGQAVQIVYASVAVEWDVRSSARVCEGQVAVITGAGRGIGRSHAMAFAAAGARVVVNDLGVSYCGEREAVSPADAVTEEIRALGCEAVPNYDDVADWNGAESLLNCALESFGRADILVNNAAIIRPASMVDTSERDFDEVVRVNLKGTYCPSRAFAGYWMNRSAGNVENPASIVCTTSRIGLHGTPYYLLYGCTKAAVAYFVAAAAAELAPYGVRVNGIAPRADTRMMKEAAQRLIEVAGDEGLSAVFGAVGTDPPREDTPQDPASISPLVVWLASRLSRPVSGKLFAVMAGRIGLMEGWQEAHSIMLPPRHTVEDVDREIAPLVR